MKKRERTDEVEDEIKTEPPETDKENSLNGGDRVGELRDAALIWEHLGREYSSGQFLWPQMNSYAGWSIGHVLNRSFKLYLIPFETRTQAKLRDGDRPGGG